jgi:hypothetical protein
MPEPIALLVKHAVGAGNAQNAEESVGISTDRSRQLSG